jgi:molybdenum cofactor cytidylyltransferase
MEFGPVPVTEAEGGILAHGLRFGDTRLKKGTVLAETDIEALRRAGVERVTVARLGADDLGEDAAAERLARALVPDEAASGLRLTAARTGRVNVYAVGPGVLVYDPDRIGALNAVDPMLTFAVLPPFAVTRDRLLVGTVKVIAYGVPAAAVEAAARHAEAALRVAPVVLQDAVLIETTLEDGPGKGEQAMRARLEALGMTLSRTVRVPHDEAALAAALTAAEADLVLILTASATSDPRDVAPEAVRLAGGEVGRFGMPVDPGNLLFVGRLGRRPVIGLPGCARSPALNGADWVLERIAAGLEVGDREIAAMGVGGLLKESPARGRPRER